MPREEVNLADVTQEAIVSQRRHLRELLASRHPRSRKFGTDAMATPEQIDSAQRALAGLVKEARSLTKDAARFASSLSLEEKRAAIVSWFESLPRQQQILLSQELNRVLNAEARGAA